MIMIQSLLSIILLLSCFTILGAGITPAQTIQRYLALVPIFGYSALIGLSYILSANLHITGQTAVGCSIFLLLVCFAGRLGALIPTFKGLWYNKDLIFFSSIITLPLISLILPAAFFGFKYFYGYVNYDFFFNSQDSYFLQTHSVIQFNKNNAAIVPLVWSADFSGRIAVGILGSFFPKWLHMTTLEFNSLLLNTIVVLFSLAISAFCKEFFNLSRKTIIFTVLFCLMSAAYAQAYSYYVLGQISVIPVFIVFCIYLKKFLETLAQSHYKLLYSYIVVLSLLLNVMFIMYAIMSFFAGCLLVVSYTLYILRDSNSRTLIPLLKTLLSAAIIFALVRILIVPESIEVIKSWIILSHRVASTTNHNDVFLVFSDYLTTDFLSILLGLVNYPASHSFLDLISPTDTFRIKLVFIAGFVGLFATLTMLRTYIKSEENSWAARSIFLCLFIIFLVISGYFFYNYAAYGIYKLQTWFMPLFIPLYVYYFSNIQTNKYNILLKVVAVLVIFLNISASIIYLSDFFVNPIKQQFVNLRGLTGNKAIRDIVDHLKQNKTQPVSLFLTNGMEIAWFADLLRSIPISKAIHNTQPLIEKDFHTPACATTSTTQSLYPAGLMIISNPHSSLGDITSDPVGGRIVYENQRYRLIDPSDLQTLIYFGAGSYPVEYFPSKSDTFPSKFRWVEKGTEVLIYSNQDKVMNLVIDVAPGYVNNNNQPRNLSIKYLDKAYTYKINSRSKLTIDNFQLHKGLNCFSIDSPDKVTRLPQYGALIRGEIPLDPRLNNFAIGYIGLEPKG